jgi:hypothetical protein
MRHEGIFIKALGQLLFKQLSLNQQMEIVV